jgi:putative oxidoreductase
MATFYKKFAKRAETLKDLPLLFFRLILAYGFYQPAINKVQDFNAIADWFDKMNYPLPLVSAYIAGITELLGVILLILGLGTRLISIPLMIVMLVAIFTVHAGNGFAAGDNGFEIPLYYLLMLFALVIYGGGRISIDYLINKDRNP